MIDTLFFIILVLNATGLFAFIAPHIGATIAQVSTILLLLNGIYLFSRGRACIYLMRRTDLKYWFVLLLLWPLFTLVYAPSIEARQIGLQVYYMSLLFATVVFTVTKGLDTLFHALSISLVISAVGLVMSMITPEYFQPVAFLSDAKINYMDRAYGFFMQPNSAAIHINLMFVGWYFLWRRKTSVLQVLAVSIFLLSILLTGSRSGIIISGIVIVFIAIDTLRLRNAKIGIRKNLFAKTIMVLLLVILSFSVLNDYLSTAYYLEGSLVDRISMMTQFRLSNQEDTLQDTSLHERIAVQSIYWSFIQERPLLGHGLGSSIYLLNNGPIYMTSHSTLLSSTMEYGILYPLFFAFMMIRLYRNPKRSIVEAIFNSRSIFQFIFIVLLIFTINGGLLDNRTFFILLGMFFAAVFCLKSVVNAKILHNKTSHPLNKRGIILFPDSKQKPVSGSPAHSLWN